MRLYTTLIKDGASLKQLEKMKVKISALEGVRGLAAATVLLSHITMLVKGIPAPTPILLLGNMATEAVIIFFILSGFVISLSITDETKPFLYLKKRLVRILPIFIISLVTAYMVELYLAESSSSMKDVIGNFLFLGSLQGFIVPVVSTNKALWSLSCEMFFYLFLFFMLFKRELWAVWIGLILASLIAYPYFLDEKNVLGHLVFNFSFSFIWVLGFFAAKVKDKISFSEITVIFGLGIALAFSRSDFINTYYDIYRLGLFSIFLIPAFVSITSGSDKNVHIPKTILYLLWILSVILLWRGNSHDQAKIFITLVLPVLLLMKQLRIFSFSWLKNILEKVSFLGKYSYALYAIHVPIILIVNALNFGWFSKVLLILFLTVLMSYYLEDVFQKYFNKKFLAVG